MMMSGCWLTKYTTYYYYLLMRVPGTRLVTYELLNMLLFTPLLPSVNCEYSVIPLQSYKFISNSNI